jgi:uncharacterized membrane protein
MEESMDGLSFLIAAASFVMVLVALNKASKLDVRIAQLKLQLGQLADEIARLRAPGAAVPPAAEAPARSVIAVDDRGVPIHSDATPEQLAQASVPPGGAGEVSRPVTTPAEAPDVPPPPRTARPDMEQALASRWFVWIGGIAIAIGGLLFVKYAYDNGLISPSLQVVLGLVVGAVLVAAGEFVRRNGAPGNQVSYVPAALSAAGLATAFAAIYAGFALYEILGSLTAFAGLAAVALGAFALSRLQGPFIAALGLLGSYATPALIPSEHPSAWGFFPYLLVILAASFATLRGRAWWWLGYGALALGTLWALLWISGGPFTAADTLPVGLFALASAVVGLFGLRGPAIFAEDTGRLLPRPRLTPPLAIGLLGLAAMLLIQSSLVHHTAHGDLSLLLLALGVTLVLAAAWAKPGIAVTAPLAALLLWLALMVWPEVAFHEWAMDERGLWSTVLGAEASRFLRWMLGAGAALTLAGLAAMRLRPARSLWALLAAAAPALFLAGAWGRVDSLMSDHLWALLAAGAAALLLAAAWVHRPEEEANLPAGILAAGAAVALVFAIDRLADNIWMTLAVAVLAAAYGFGARLLRSLLMGPVTAALGSFVTLRLFVSRELWNDQRDLPLGQHWVIYGYGVPAVLFLVASRWLKQAGHLRSAVALEGLSLGLAISLVSLELRVLINGNLVADAPGLLEMAAHILTWAGAAYGLMYRQQLYSSFVSLWGSRALLAAAVAGILLFSLTSLNPVVNEEPVPGNVVFNALLLAYLAPVPLLGLIARKLSAIGWEKLRPAVGLLALLLAFTYVTLETKRVFQGHLMQLDAESIAESYAYSAVWLAFAVALFAAGIRLARQYVRYAGLGVMVLVVLKVFLWDMSSLEGLYRIASFVGLGLCLVGIGWLYQRFVQGVSKTA